MSVTVQLTSSLTYLDSAGLLMLNWMQIYKFGQIQTSQTGRQLCNDTSPYKVSECSLLFSLIEHDHISKLAMHE